MQVARASDPTPELPSLDAGVQLLETNRETTRALHALAVDHVLQAGGDACWVDTGGHAQTDALVEVAPSDRILDRVHVARGFTPFQHLALLADLPTWLPADAAAVVVPELDCPYREPALLADEGREILLAGIAVLARVARERDIPVLVTRHGDDHLGEILTTAATRRLICEATPFGPRFRADDGDTETLVYPVDGTGTVQTTLAFWREVLAAREPLYATSTQEVTSRGAH